MMPKTTLTLPELGLVGMTRGMLGIGIGLLIADHLSKDQRRAVGWTLLGVGIATTFPLAAAIFHHTSTQPHHPAATVPKENEETVLAPS